MSWPSIRFLLVCDQLIGIPIIDAATCSILIVCPKIIVVFAKNGPLKAWGSHEMDEKILKEVFRLTLHSKRFFDTDWIENQALVPLLKEKVLVKMIAEALINLSDFLAFIEKVM